MRQAISGLPLCVTGAVNAPSSSGTGRNLYPCPCALNFLADRVPPHLPQDSLGVRRVFYRKPFWVGEWMWGFYEGVTVNGKCYPKSCRSTLLPIAVQSSWTRPCAQCAMPKTLNAASTRTGAHRGVALGVAAPKCRYPGPHKSILLQLGAQKRPACHPALNPMPCHV